jgi:glutaredoxin
MMAATPDMETILYTRQGCCLCDEARATLEQHGLTVQSVDIDRDPALRDKYDLLVPVVWIGGRERFRGQVNPILLRRLLEN